jgi:hypothetical protein
LRRRLISGFFAFICATGVPNCIALKSLHGQEAGDDSFDVTNYRAMLISIVARVTDKSAPELSWKYESSKLTIPGRPVSVKLVGSNIIILVQLTPYLTEADAVILVAQGQVWIAGIDKGLDYRSSLKTIPATFGEKLFFFPLGLPQSATSAQIEIEIIIESYKEPLEGDASNTEASSEQRKK